MKANNKEELYKALNECRLSELPKKATDKVVWVKAIIKALTSKGDVTYCIAFQPTYKGQIAIKKAFSNESIVKVLEIYPYEIIAPSTVKNIINSTKEEIYETLKPLLYKKDIEAYSEEELKVKALQMQIDATLIDKPKI